MKRTTKQQFKPVKAYALYSEDHVAVCTCHAFEHVMPQIFFNPAAAKAELREKHWRVVPVLIQPLPARGKTNPSKKVARGKKTKK